MDEIEGGVEVVATLRQRYPDATLVVGSRAEAVEFLAADVAFTLLPWTPADGERFLSAIAAVRPRSATMLRSLGPSASPLLTNPLTATLAAFVAIDARGVPPNRTQLFRAAVAKLTQAWAGRRVGNPLWEDVGDEVRSLALAHLQGEHEVVARADLADLVARVAPDRSEALRRTVEVDLGLLVPSGDGYEFLVREVAEYLAGEALQGDIPATLEAAAHGWGAAAARHSLVLLASRDLVAFRAAVCELMERVRTDTDGALSALRRLEVLALVLGDVADGLSEPFANDFAELATPELLQEGSPWRAQRIASALADLAGRPSRCWAALRDRLLPYLEDRRSPVDYVRACPGTSPEVWLPYLCHCDADVRAEAVRRLSSHVDDSTVISAFSLMIADSPALPCWRVPPAIEVGLALRRADRAGPVQEFLDLLRALADRDSQIMSAAAAIALLPGEHDSRILARALRNGANGGYVPADVVSELGFTTHGAAALDAEWPAWRTYSSRADGFAVADGRDPPPPSMLTRRRVAELVVGALAHDEVAHERLLAARLEGVRDLHFRALIETGIHHPSRVVAFLHAHSAELFPFLPPEAEDALGRASIRHVEVREALIGKWAEFLLLDHARRMAYPGRALEPLVVAGFEAAREAYVAWLPHSRYGVGFYAEPSPDAQVFKFPDVACVGERIARAAWSHATVGSGEGGVNRIRLAPGSAASVLAQFLPAWQLDEDAIQQLFGWLAGSEVDERRAALQILGRARLVNEGVLVGRLRGALLPTTIMEDFVVTSAAIDVISTRGLASLFRDELCVLAARRLPSSLAAACLVIGILPPREGAIISRLVSESELGLSALAGMNGVQLHALVSRAPTSWMDAVARHVERGGAVNFGIVMPFVRALPLRERRSAIARIRPMCERWILPWCNHDFTNEVYRPSDLVECARYECGEV